jgi:hypothetical protein
MLGIVSNQGVIFDRVEGDDLLFLRGIPSIELDQLWWRWEGGVLFQICYPFGGPLLGVLGIVKEEIVLANHDNVSMLRF